MNEHGKGLTSTSSSTASPKLIGLNIPQGCSYKVPLDHMQVLQIWRTRVYIGVVVWTLGPVCVTIRQLASGLLRLIHSLAFC
jgi:hypothetical protein